MSNISAALNRDFEDMTVEERALELELQEKDRRAESAAQILSCIVESMRVNEDSQYSMEKYASAIDGVIDILLPE